MIARFVAIALLLAAAAAGRGETQSCIITGGGVAVIDTAIWRFDKRQVGKDITCSIFTRLADGKRLAFIAFSAEDTDAEEDLRVAARLLRGNGDLAIDPLPKRPDRLMTLGGAAYDFDQMRVDRVALILDRRKLYQGRITAWIAPGEHPMEDPDLKPIWDEQRAFIERIERQQNK